jgi:hypothetical protein
MGDRRGQNRGIEARWPVLYREGEDRRLGNSLRAVSLRGGAVVRLGDPG